MSVKDLYPAIRPSLNLDFANTKTLDPRITFSRASTGTYYDGVTHAKTEENLFTYSQQFNTGWTGFREVITPDDTTAPDGTTTADSVAQESGQTIGASVAKTVSVSAGDCVISIYAKPNGRNFLLIQEQLLDGTVNNTWFDVSTGAVGTTDAGHTATITASTNSFYRCSIKFTANASRTGGIGFFVLDTNGTLTVADDGNGLYLWGAQLEQRSSVTAYTATTTQPITNYIPVLQSAAAGEARFDHDPVTGESKGLLIEEQRTNLLQRSEEFDNAAWGKVGTGGSPAVIVTGNQAIAPDGTLSADKLIAGTGVGTHYLQQTVTAYTAATLSVFAKAAEATKVRLALFSSGVVAEFDLSAGTSSGGGTNSIISVGNGWYRCIVSATGLSNSLVQIYTGDNAAGDAYNGVYIWGAQLEAATFPTSYIKTTSAQATRSPDSASMTGTNFSEWFNPGEGALFADFSVNAIEAQVNNGIAYISDGGSDNRIRINSANGGIRAQVRKNAVNTYDYTVSGYTSPSEQKAILAFKFNDAASIVSGDTVNTDSTVEIPQVDELDIGGAGGTVDFSGTIKKIAYWPQRLTNAQLQALTEG